MVNVNELGWEEQVNTKKENKNLYAQLAKDYSREKLKDSDSRSEYLQSLDWATTVSPEMLTDIKNFADRDREWKYDGIEITADKISLWALKREATWYFASIANNRRSVKDVILQEYDIGEDALGVKIDEPLKWLSEQQLRDLHENEKNRKAFMNQHFWVGNLPREKSIANFLREMNLETKYKLVKPENEIAFHDLVKKINTWKTLDDLDIEWLLESGIYTQQEKKELIAKLLPSISLAKAKQFNLIEARHATDLKDEYIRSVDPDLHRGAVREISSSIADEDVIISTDKFTGLKKNVDKIIENPHIFDDFIETYNKTVTWYREELEWKQVVRSKDFLGLLAQHPQVSWAENFQPGGIIQINQTQKDSEGKMRHVVVYWKVESLGEDGSFSYTEKGSDSYDVAGTTKQTQNYNDFLKFLSEGNPQKSITLSGIQVLSEAQLESKISSWEIKEYNGTTLRLPSKDKINSDISDMTRDINGLKEALRDREVQIRNDLHDQWFDDWYIKENSDEIIAGDPTIQDYKKKIADLEQKQFEKTQSLDHLESSHLETLIDKINESDSDGEKYGFKRGTTFKTESWQIYTITQDPNLAAWEIHITSLAGAESFSFEDFYRGFSSQNTKRISNAPADFSAMVDNLQSSWEDKLAAWKNFSFSWWKIEKKDSKTKIKYDYLWSKHNNELIKIHDISWDRITVSFWELKSKNKVKKDKDGNEELKRWDNEKIVKDETFSMENREYVVSTGFLEQYIKDNSLEPRWLKDNQEVSADSTDVKAMKKNVHFWSAVFHNRATISDAVKWGQLFVEQMKDMIEKWSDEKANQFALKYMGAVLTEDARRDMQSRLEQKQKKSMEDYLERLKTVASDVAVKMIDQWLHDKYAPDYMHEAATVFMLEKYGALNAKALQKYEWKFIWYQALGGEIDDPFFKKIKAEKEDADLPFTEELLVYRLLKKQCWPQWFNGKRRRSKLHKEVKKHRATGKEEEYETGKRDGGDERTLDGRVEWGMWEMYSNNYPNMVGWLEVAVNKWGPMHTMNKIPFIAAFSWVAYNFEEKITDQLKNFPWGTRLLMMLRFFSHTSQLDLLNQTILAICHKLEARGNPKHKWIAARAQALFDDRHNPGDGVRAKLKKTEIFYEEYGKDLTDILYMLNTWDKNDTHSKLIFFEKDGDDEHSKTLNKYYHLLHDFVDADTSFEDEGLMSDPFKGAGTSGIELHKWAEQQLGLRQGQFKKHTSWPMSWDEVQNELKAIPHRQYDSDPEKNKKMQVKLLTDNLGRMMSGIMISVGTNARELSGYNTPTGPFNILNKWGVDMTRFEEASDFSVHDLAHPKEWTETKQLVVEFANQIIQAELHGTNFSHKIVNDLWPNSKWTDINKNVVSIANSVNSTIGEKKEKPKKSYPSMNPSDEDFDLAA